MRDIVVIGAGPAGSIAAASLARRGHDVVLLEEHGDVGEPVHCTGLVGEDAFQEFDLPRTLVLGHAGAARFWGAAGQSVRVEAGNVRAAVVDRAALDRLLAERAVEMGAELRQGARADGIDVTADRVTVQVRDSSQVDARACVLACGANYRFHRRLGLGLPTVFLQSAQLETPYPEQPGIEVRFGREVAPGGFAWLVPLRRQDGPRARVGLMCETRARQRFQQFVASLTDAQGWRGCPEPLPRLKMLPLGPITRTHGDRVLAVGDAAGLVKPTTGGGIYYGMLSGGIAADVLDGALRRDRLDAEYLARYERAWRARLGPDIDAGLRFRRLAARLSDASIDALIDLAKIDGVVPLLQRTASFNWHRKAALALLAHPAVRQIVLRSWTKGAASR